MSTLFDNQIFGHTLGFCLPRNQINPSCCSPFPARNGFAQAGAALLVWWLPLTCPGDKALWQLPVAPQWISVTPHYRSLRREPINELHRNHICTLIRELPWRILIRGDTFRASSTILLSIPFETRLGSVSTIQIETRCGTVGTACFCNRRQE